MSIFVTGGTGFVGSYLLRYLLAEGYTDITALRRSSSNMDLVSDVAHRIQWIEGEINDPFCLREAVQGKDWVFHIAAIISFLPKDRPKMMEVNIEGTKLLVNACLDAGVKKLIHVSSIAAIGRTKPKQTLDEKSIYQPSPYNSDYGLSKFLSEQEVWRGIAEGLNAAIVNPSAILGAGRWYEGTGQFFPTLHKGFGFFPTGFLNIVDVRDVARMMVVLAKSDISEERFIAAAGEMNFRDFFTAITEHLQAPKPRIKITPLLRELTWRAALVPAWITGKTPIVTKENLRQASLELVFKNDKSKKLLQFEYTPIAQTIADTCEAYLKSGGKTTVFD